MRTAREKKSGLSDKALLSNGQVQHAGVIVGIRGIAGNMFQGLPKGYSGYLHKASTQQDLSAVTAACMMVKPFCI